MVIIGTLLILFGAFLDVLNAYWAVLQLRGKYKSPIMVVPFIFYCLGITALGYGQSRTANMLMALCGLLYHLLCAWGVDLLCYYMSDRRARFETRKDIR